MSLNIFSDQANTTYIASGSTIDIKVRLYGNFALRNNGGATVLYPQLRMVVNGDVAWADLYTLSAENTGSGYKTDAVFRYVVKPGDMASPLRIYGFSGIGEVPGNGYQFYWNGWEICNQDSGSNAVWRANYEFAEAGFGLSNEHLNFGAQKVFIRTLAFDENDSPVSVAATQATTWRVTTVDPVESAVVDFYVWTTGTNMVQIGTVANQTALLVSMPTGSTNADFLVRGLAMGTANIYLQRAKDCQNNATVGVTNFIKRTITVTVAPEPTVSVVMSSTGTDNVTLNETSVLNTGAFTVNLSQAFTNDVYVRLDTLPAGQGYVTFGTSPFVVRIPAGSTVSSEQRFSVPDGNVTSMWGVVISPVVTNAAADSYFTIKRAGTVFVQNVSPTLILPAATDVPTAMRGVPFTFSWQASDGASDMADGMKATWNFNGETTTNVSGSSGSIAYTFNSTGTKTVKVKVTDKDGQVSDEVQFTVTVVLPPPKPSVRVVTSDLAYTETKTDSTGSLVVYLSEAYPADVWVQLTAFLMGASQSNIVFATTNAIRITQGNTNSPTIKFSLKDGTQASEIYGIDIVPTVTDSPAKSYFTDPQRTTVFVDNVRPTVTCPLARDMALVPSPEYTNIPMGRPFTFTYTVGDVDRDLPSMAVTWNFGDGCSAVVTGAMGNVAHTFSSLGRKYIMVQAQDKDGGYSDEIEFPITVVPPPPDPTVFILSPAEVLSETTTPRTGSFVVQLSEAFTNAVTVGLAVSPVTNAVNGAIVLSTNRVTFAVGETEKAVYISARDGTDVSWLCGFTIIPTVLGNAAAINYFKEVIPGYVDVMNVSPVITTPVATDVATDDFLYTVARGTAWAFGWSVSDVADDLKSMPVADALTVTWDFGDGGTGTGYGGLGTINHTYMASGDMIVSVTATDKDGGSSKVCFKVRVVATPLVFHVDASRPDDSGPGMDWTLCRRKESRGGAVERPTLNIEVGSTGIACSIDVIVAADIQQNDFASGDPHDENDSVSVRQTNGLFAFEIPR